MAGGAIFGQRASARSARLSASARRAGVGGVEGGSRLRPAPLLLTGRGNKRGTEGGKRCGGFTVIWSK